MFAPRISVTLRQQAVACYGVLPYRGYDVQGIWAPLSNYPKGPRVELWPPASSTRKAACEKAAAAAPGARVNSRSLKTGSRHSGPKS